MSEEMSSSVPPISQRTLWMIPDTHYTYVWRLYIRLGSLFFTLEGADMLNGLTGKNRNSDHFAPLLVDHVNALVSWYLIYSVPTKSGQRFQFFQLRQPARWVQNEVLEIFAFLLFIINKIQHTTAKTSITNIANVQFRLFKSSCKEAGISGIIGISPSKGAYLLFISSKTPIAV